MLFSSAKYSLLILDTEFEAALVEMMVRHRTRQSNGEPDGKVQSGWFEFDGRVCDYILIRNRDSRYGAREPTQKGSIIG